MGASGVPADRYIIRTFCVLGFCEKSAESAIRVIESTFSQESFEIKLQNVRLNESELGDKRCLSRLSSCSLLR